VEELWNDLVLAMQVLICNHNNCEPGNLYTIVPCRDTVSVQGSKLNDSGLKISLNRREVFIEICHLKPEKFGGRLQYRLKPDSEGKWGVIVYGQDFPHPSSFVATTLMNTLLEG
jgi:hypothetical protein